MEKFRDIIKSGRPVLVDFYAAWCGPCKVMHPILENLKAELGEQVRIIKIDIDSPDNRSLVELYNIQSVPTMFLFKNGQIVWRHTGAIGLEPLREIMERYHNN